jgi:5-methylcytosine-specific restriction protein B
MIDSRVVAELRTLEKSLEEDGKLPPARQLQHYYDAFRQRFGPEALRALDGEALLETMHNHGNRNSLVYWIEFKDDEEFPALFGSIAGGSSFKFGVYKRRETGAWAVQGPDRSPKEIDVGTAIEIARRHRDQLLLASEAVGRLPARAGDEEYARLQVELERVAPNVHDTAWGHKYLALIHPDRLDDFHSPEYQRYNLMRVLQVPPAGEGRYLAAGRYVALAAELQMGLHTLTTVMNRRHGRPRRYWRIGTTDDPSVPRNQWPPMRDGSLVAIGWPDVGDLSTYEANASSREAVIEKYRRHYPGDPRLVGRKGREIFRFVTQIADGDIVLACDGTTVLGVGEVVGPYRFQPDLEFPHHHPVRWRSLAEWQLPVAEGLRTTVFELSNFENLVEAERRILDAHLQPAPRPAPTPSVPASPSSRRSIRLEGVMGRVQAVLDRKSQVILYGPPGTGKTYWATRTALELAATRAFGLPFGGLAEAQQRRVVGDPGAQNGLVRTCTFHPEYGYEDFIEGYRPQVGPGGQLAFALVPGLFRRLCTDAARSSDDDFYLIIDEVNRGDIPRIFGELLTVLERDKRGREIALPLSGETFAVPSNVYVIATMNTADRSIALLDAALRRRFGFVPLFPDYTVLRDVVIEGLPLGPWLEHVNRHIRELTGGDGRNRQVGHAFFLDGTRPIRSVAQLIDVLCDDIIPLLEEYCYEDFSRLEQILGSSLVDRARQCLRLELFTVARAPDLVQALLAPCPEIVTTASVSRGEDAAALATEETEDAGDDAATDPS